MKARSGCGGEETAVVYNIQHYSLHDGPGIRTLVFFKGCPLRCKWCCNPESQRAERELFYVRQKCLGQKACGRCASVCAAGAVGFDETGRAAVDRSRCDNCFACVLACPSKALEVQGVSMTIAEILEEVERNAVFFRRGNGGLTLSGGEPLMQGSFLVRLLKEAREHRLHTALETSGFAGYAILDKVANYLSAIYYDVKSLDEQKHLAFTGRSNRLVLQNLLRLCKEHPHLPKVIRTPVIPGFNDSLSDMASLRDFVSSLPNAKHETLPYHRFGIGKYAALGREYPFSLKTDSGLETPSLLE